LNAQSESVKRILAHFSTIEGCAAGLSSMGPLVYVIADESDRHLDSQIVDICAKFGTRLLEKCKGRNSGFEVVE